jgi:hypothetical protein
MGGHMSNQLPQSVFENNASGGTDRIPRREKLQRLQSRAVENRCRNDQNRLKKWQGLTKRITGIGLYRFKTRVESRREYWIRGYDIPLIVIFPEKSRSDRQQWASKSNKIAYYIHPDSTKKGKLRKCQQKRNTEKARYSFVPSSPQTAMRRNSSCEMEADLDIREKQIQQKQKMPQRNQCSQTHFLKRNEQREIAIRI